MLASHGPGRVTMDAVAAMAGVGKPTIYRYWPNARMLEMAAMLEQPSPDTGVRPAGNAIGELRAQLGKVVDSFSTPRGRQMAQMVATTTPDSELAKLFRNQIILKSRGEGRSILERGITEGCIRPDVEIEAVLDMIYGAMFYRLLVGHAPLTLAFADQLVDLAMMGLAVSGKEGVSP
jgi:AcrR family transcriptional regulator